MQVKYKNCNFAKNILTKTRINATIQLRNRINARKEINMQVNVNLLIQKIEERDMSLDKFAKSIGINPSTFYRQKRKRFQTMSIGQMHSSVEVLNMTAEDAKDIFLFENSH